MDLSIKEIRKSQEGFTLVELAVVMIIIGLLIGGILKGQELITNARVTSTASQLEAMGAAYNGFRDKFNAIPGDMSSATTRIGSCGTIDACADGGGDGTIEVALGDVNAGDEGTYFFGQLLAADFITGMDGTDDGTNVEFGVTNPTAPIGGGFLAGDVRSGVTGFDGGELRPAPYVVVTGVVADVGAGNGVLTPQQAANIDRRLDDGQAGTGSIVGQNDDGECRDTGTDEEYSAADDQACVIAYRIQ